MADHTLELSVVVPTFNERGNLGELLRRLDLSLQGIAWEVIVVDDDSPDQTAALARQLAQQDRRVRCLQRVGRRGLASACIEGMLASAAPYLAVMDADMQHDETRLAEMLRLLRSGGTDIVVGSRYVVGGDEGARDRTRASMTAAASRLSRLVCRQDVSDPMSGFFMLPRQTLEKVVRRLSGVGFKILLDILASSPSPLCVREVPYTFRDRFAGESKLDTGSIWEYGMLLADKLFGGYVPVRFLSFILVGSAGVVVHMAVLTALLKGVGVPFPASQTWATIVAILFNFSVNNVLTYRDMRLRGRRWLRGLATFMLACGIGAVANVGVSSYLFDQRTGWILAGLAGIAVGAAWNYVVTLEYTWRRVARSR